MIETAQNVGTMMTRFQGESSESMHVYLDGKEVRYPYLWNVRDGYVIHYDTRPKVTGAMSRLYLDHGKITVEVPSWWPARELYAELYL